MAKQPSLDEYLALVPRGLQYAAIEGLTEQLSEYTLEIEIVGESVSEESNFALKLQQIVIAQGGKSRRKNTDIEPVCALPVGSSIEIPDSALSQKVSVGYIAKDKPIWSCSGVLSGVVWIKITTSAPVDAVSRLRILGPLVSLIGIWENLQMKASQSLEEAVDSLRNALNNSKNYPFLEALNVWHRHVQSAWNLSIDDLLSISHKLKGEEAMKYRLSMIRSDSEKYQYTRQEFLYKAADIAMPTNLGEAWTVDLNNYDVEVVLLVHPQALAIGLALRPYQHLKVKSFASGTIPPDVTPPVLPGEVLSKIIRLRPTTAQLLLQLAKVEPGDVVLDPCAGLGTIPVETMFHKTGAIGIGGDLALQPEAIGPLAASNAIEANLHKSVHQSGCTELTAWDATSLPLRTGSVDVAISDLPFGVQCLSKAGLEAMLPLLFSEVARVLRPGGRIVMLCGNYVSAVRALNQLNTDQDSPEEQQAILTPVDSIFPTNIGGLQAWVIVARRGTGIPRHIPNHREKVQKATRKRERVEKQRKNNDNRSKKRSDFQS